MIRVVLADDHALVRAGLRQLLTSAGDIDVVLMDLNLPTVSGVTATAAIAKASDAPAVLALTMVDDDDTVLAVLRAGARGYVLKGAPGEEIVAGIRTVAAGGAVFGAGVASRVLAATADGGGLAPSIAEPADDLTDREREVLSLVAEGASNSQIARSLGLSVKTVQNYVSRILDKLQVADRTQAALLQRRRTRE